MKVQSRDEAKATVLERLKSSYGGKMNVEFSRAELETDLSGMKFWVVEGVIHIRRWLFRRRQRRFTYYVDAENGQILIMRMKKG